MNHLELVYKTVTPLYTGNADGKVDTLRTTGLMGSLRWWFEMLVRGFGGLARDPVGGANLYKIPKGVTVEQFDDIRAYYRKCGLDDVAQIFGGTNWRRRFRLEVTDNHLRKATIATKIELPNHTYIDKDRNRRTPAWYLKKKENTVEESQPLEGQFVLNFRTLHPQFDISLIAGLLTFVEQHGGLGAKNQHGFGVIEQVEGANVDTSALASYLTSLPPTEDESQTALPSLRNMFFAQFDAESDSQREPYALKYALRNILANRDNKQVDRREYEAVRHFVMGWVRKGGNEREAAKIKMSLPHGASNRVRLWGWLPQSHSVYNDRWNRDAILHTFHQYIGQQYSNVAWREFDSDRDTMRRHSEIATYFADLLQGGA